MTDTPDTPDYRTMSGAEFRHEVGTDPEKWAEAFLQRAIPDASGLVLDQAECARWFADAMQAARVDEQHHRIA
jgi:hypothetical protein